MFLRSTTFAVSLLTSAFIATPALASSITIEQRSDVHTYGEWMLTLPDGNDVTSFRQEQSRTINTTPTGTYTIQVKPPAGATPTIRILNGITVLQSITGKTISFPVGSDVSLTVQIAYTYQGSITVESVPSGAHVDMTTASGLHFSGTTPMTVRELPPQHYMVKFGSVASCIVPKPMKRALPENEHIVFKGVFHCGTSGATSTSSATSSTLSTASSSSMGSVRQLARVVQFSDQTETIAGGILSINVGVINTSRSTLHDIILTQQFDVTKLSVKELPAGANIDGNLIVWRLPYIYAGQRWSSTVSFTTLSSAQNGQTMEVTARISSDELDGAAGDPLVHTLRVGVAAMPATGGAFDVLLAILGILVPAPLVLGFARRK